MTMVMKLREVELYENERYIPISGWSNKVSNDNNISCIFYNIEYVNIFMYL